jgi:carbamoyltransferase
VVQFRRSDFDGLASVLGAPQPLLSRKRADLAAALQAITDEVMLSLARSIHRRYPCDALCVAGGVGLNCHSNWVMKEEGPFTRIYIPSAPHDAGTAVGAALHHHHQASAASPPRREQPSGNVMPLPYLGPAFSEAEIEGSLRAHGLLATRPRCIEGEAARLLAEGKIVGWFQDRMEFGPRALGNRSLLADPRDPQMRETLNRKVKHREAFRPFAPSLLLERWSTPTERPGCSSSTSRPTHGSTGSSRSSTSSPAYPWSSTPPSTTPNPSFVRPTTR